MHEQHNNNTVNFSPYIEKITSFVELSCITKFLAVFSSFPGGRLTLHPGAIGWCGWPKLARTPGGGSEGAEPPTDLCLMAKEAKKMRDSAL